MWVGGKLSLKPFWPDQLNYGLKWEDYKNICMHMVIFFVCGFLFGGGGCWSGLLEMGKELIF